MKKKQSSGKVVKSKSTDLSHKKISLLKKTNKKQQPQIFVFLGDNFYVAETKTQRKNYKDFEQKLKTPKTPLKKSRVKSINKPVQNINIQQYVKLLSKQQKQKLFKDLSEQMKEQPLPKCLEQPKHQDKLQLFLQKLQSIKSELLEGWDHQINEINVDFENEHIGLEEKNEKILLLQKIRDNKMNMLNYTQVLFERILKEEPDFQLQKSQKIENIINSLDQMADSRGIYHHPLQIYHNNHQNNKDFTLKQLQRQRQKQRQGQKQRQRQKRRQSQQDYQRKIRQNYEKLIRQKELHEFFEQDDGDDDGDDNVKNDSSYKQLQNTPVYVQMSKGKPFGKYEKQVKNMMIISSQEDVALIDRASQEQQHIRSSLSVNLNQEKVIKEEEEYYQPSPLIFNKQSLEFNKESLVFNKQPLVFNKQSLKLDLRLDEVQFGKDHYDDQIDKDEQSTSSNLMAQSNLVNNSSHTSNNNHHSSNSNNKAENSEFKLKQHLGQPLNLNFKKINDQQFISISQQNNKILKIPMLMTKDRLQQLQLQKTSKQIQMMNIFIKNKQSFQLSQINIDQQHFTTLVDVNQFVVQFYEFLMSNSDGILEVEMQEVIDGLNIPYGKSCVDKLRILKKEGYIGVEDNNNILKREYLDNFHSQFQLHVRRLTEFQRVHNRAVFDAFNAGLNVYRPFFELQGEVYPWTTSEKGLTFYEISDDNIEEVFQKSKMKVLEYSSSLCGLIPGCETTTQQPKKILQKRNNEYYQRIVKSQIVQKYAQWNIHKINFQTLFRLTISQQIFQTEMELLFQELQQLKQQRQR